MRQSTRSDAGASGRRFKGDRVPPVELLALGSAVCTALAGAVMAKLSGRVHPVAATRWSMIFATLIATAGALVVGDVGPI